MTPTRSMSYEPIYAVCSLGKARWFWIADPIGKNVHDVTLADLTTGYAPDQETALRTARAIAGPRAKDWGRWLAVCVHREIVQAKRAAHPSKGTGAAAVDFVCREGLGDEGGYYWVRHRIIKKTKTRYYVDVEYFVEGDAVRNTSRSDTFVLDRVTLERTGEARGKRHGVRDTYYLKPHPYHEVVADCPPYLDALGLDASCTETAIRSAYRRKARAAHPDAGGNDTSFIALTSAYEQALRFVGGGA